MKIDLNSNNCQWKHLAKQVTDHIKQAVPGTPQLGEMSIDEISELGICDVKSRQQRIDLLKKKPRKVHLGQIITLRIILKNTLSTNITLRNMNLICTSEEVKEGQFCKRVSQNVELRSQRQKEIFLKVQPTQLGSLTI
mmetsp:Transcript_3545/g.6038  ORF Transcript_3545/g.6038 Transcript_3545/m.6038 type:complete len:138 (+) Transcript_3545:790-1203(+)